MDDAAWRVVETGSTQASEIIDVQSQRRFWVRATHVVSGTESPQWSVFGPLRGDDQTLDVLAVKDTESPGLLQLETARSAPEEAASIRKAKGLKFKKCCRIKVRIRVVTKVPSVTVGKPVPDITVRWRRALPEVTVRGPEIVVRDLPRVPRIDNPLPPTGPIPNVGMHCEVIGGDAVMSVQNAESAAVDVWINWKGFSIMGPGRIEPKKMHSLGKTGYSDCEVAGRNIYISKVEWSR